MLRPVALPHARGACRLLLGITPSHSDRGNLFSYIHSPSYSSASYGSASCFPVGCSSRFGGAPGREVWSRPLVRSLTPEIEVFGSSEKVEITLLYFLLLSGMSFLSPPLLGLRVSLWIPFVGAGGRVLAPTPFSFLSRQRNYLAS